MASIQTAIQLTDQMTAPIRNITAALNMMINTFETVESVSGNALNSTAINTARERVAQANAQLELMASDVSRVGTEIQRNTSNQTSFNNSIQNGTSGMSALANRVQGMVAAYMGIQGIEKVMGASDNLAQTTARLNLINDKMQTTQELQDKIFQSAERARSSYDSTASSVAKLGLLAGKAFSSNDEIIRFSELMNKSFKIGGSDKISQAAGMYQLTQAMSSGRLQGDEYKSIIENAPLLKNAIEDYMKNVQHAQGSMKDWSAEGLLTADVIKNALFSAADDVNKQFETIPVTFGDVANSIKNNAERAFAPFLKKLNDGLNSKYGQQAINNVTNAIIVLAAVANGLYDTVANIGMFISDNWTIIAPIVGGIAVAFGLYTAALIANNIAQGIHKIAVIASTVASVAHGATITAEMTATTGLTAAQLGFNAALYACPIVWIVLAIIAVIVAIFIVIAVINKMTNSHISAVGVITGGINVVIQFFKNLGLQVADIALGIWNALGAVVDNIVTAFSNGIKNIQSFWYNLLSTILTVVANVCEALNKIPFIEFDYSGLTSAADDYAAKAAKIAGNKGSYKSVGDAFDKGMSTYDAFSKGWVSDAYKDGYDFGKGLDDKIKSFFKKNETKDEKDKDSIDDYQSTIPDNLSSINDNTKNISDSLDITNENLKYIRDFAEERAVNRYTTATIKVDMTNHNSINSDHDIDGIVTKLKTRIEDEMYASAEGVH